MTILTVVLVIILAAILVVAAELYVLIREVGRLILGAQGERESREAPPSGQTINVNLSPIGGVGQPVADIQGKPVKAATAPAASKESESAGGGSGEAPSEAKSASEERSPTKKSGGFAVECPRCHAENSSYRVECFNCGNPL
jgi:hypothetical protein